MTSSSGLHGVPTVAARRATSSLAVPQDGPMRRVRFAPSPTGTLHIGNALSAVANRAFGDWMLLRIDDTDPARNVPGGEEAIVARSRSGSGVGWDEGPVRQSERAERYREAAEQLGTTRFDGVTLAPRGRLGHLPARLGGRRHRLRDHARHPRERPPAERAVASAPARGARDGSARVHPPRADPRRRREEAVQARRGGDGRVAAGCRHPCRGGARYLEELGLPRHDVHLDLARVRRLAIEAIEALPGRGACGPGRASSPSTCR